MITTTLNDIRAHDPCKEGWEKLLKYLGKTKADDDPLSLPTILESNGLDDALWCLRALPAEMDGPVRLLACDFAEQALKYVPEGEDRPRQAIETARKYARGEATDEELAAAGAAADAAADAAWAAARAAADAAWAAARAAAWAAAAAARAAATADAAAWAAAWEEQERIFREWLSEGEDK